MMGSSKLDPESIFVINIFFIPPSSLNPFEIILSLDFFINKSDSIILHDYDHFNKGITEDIFDVGEKSFFKKYNKKSKKVRVLNLYMEERKFNQALQNNTGSNNNTNIAIGSAALANNTGDNNYFNIATRIVLELVKKNKYTKLYSFFLPGYTIIF